MAKYKIKADLGHVAGYVEKAHFDLEIDKKKWDNMTEDEQEDYLLTNGNLVISSFDMESNGGITKISKEEL